MKTATALNRVVELNECAKTMRRYAFEVSLSALGAIVRSSRTGSELLGFNEVASQMRHWSRDLELAVKGITALTTERIRLVSQYLRRQHVQVLLSRARDSTENKDLMRECLQSEDDALGALLTELRHGDTKIAEAFEDIAQLGLMASVLSRAALIEAASGSGQQRSELTIASQEFAAYAERVNDAIAAVQLQHRGTNA